MPGAMSKLGRYLGLVEDEEDGRDRRYDAYDEDEDDEDAPVTVRSGRSERTAPRRLDDTAARNAGPHNTHGSSALDTAVRPTPAPAYDDAYRITTLHPRTYNEARGIGEHFRSGTPVIMNLTEMDDTDAKRLVDFAAGLSFGLHGRIERVTNKVFLLSPEHVEVTAEDKARIVEGGFFNQS